MMSSANSFHLHAPDAHPPLKREALLITTSATGFEGEEKKMKMNDGCDDCPRVGGRLHCPDGTARIMAICEGWLMLRKKGAAPFLLHQSDIGKRYHLKPTAPAKAGKGKGEANEYTEISYDHTDAARACAT